jgi:hypothetical protein
MKRRSLTLGDKDGFMADATARDRTTLGVIVAVLLTLPSVSQGATLIVVGSGTPESCTELALHGALAQAEYAAGALIRFACGADPVTIYLTQLSGHESPVFLVPPHKTTIDGGGLVTLHGGYSPASILFIAPNTTVNLLNIGVTGTWGYSAVRNEGKLDVKQAYFFGNAFNAIENFGSITVKNTLFADNGSLLMALGGSITTWGTATIESSSFINNGGDGGAVFSYGSLFVKNSTFTNNHAEWFAGGVTTYGLADMDNCKFFYNRGFAGGAVSNYGAMLTVKNSAFVENEGISPGAGGITSWSGDVTVTNTEFLRNRGTYAGGIYSGAALSLSNSLLEGNAARYGGGITIGFTGNQTTIINSSIINNTASVDGGGLYVQGDVFPRIVRTTVSGNSPNDIGSEL